MLQCSWLYVSTHKHLGVILLQDTAAWRRQTAKTLERALEKRLSGFFLKRTKMLKFTKVIANSSKCLSFSSGLVIYRSLALPKTSHLSTFPFSETESAESTNNSLITWLSWAQQWLNDNDNDNYTLVYLYYLTQVTIVMVVWYFLCFLCTELHHLKFPEDKYLYICSVSLLSALSLTLD